MFTTIVNTYSSEHPCKVAELYGDFKIPRKGSFYCTGIAILVVVLLPGYERRLYRNLALEIVPEKVNLE